MEELIDAVAELLDRRPVPIDMHLDDWGMLATALKAARTERDMPKFIPVLYVVTYGDVGMYRTQEAALQVAQEYVTEAGEKAHVATVTHRVSLKRSAEVEQI